MLVINRKEGQAIVIDDKITITINRVAGGRVSLGIEAPQEIPVRRSELPPREDVESEAA